MIHVTAQCDRCHSARLRSWLILAPMTLLGRSPGREAQQRTAGSGLLTDPTLVGHGRVPGRGCGSENQPAGRAGQYSTGPHAVARRRRPASFTSGSREPMHNENPSLDVPFLQEPQAARREAAGARPRRGHSARCRTSRASPSIHGRLASCWEPMPGSIAARSPRKPWRTVAGDQASYGKAIGTSDLLPGRLLQAGAQLSRAVCELGASDVDEDDDLGSWAGPEVRLSLGRSALASEEPATASHELAHSQHSCL